MLRDETKTVAWESRLNVIVLQKSIEVNAFAKLLGVTKKYSGQYEIGE